MNFMLQVLLRDSKNIKEELLSEYRSSFNHFDKERLGLNDEQLKCVSLCKIFPYFVGL